ncbi:hypothetical protein ACE6H2_006281 [Prunus campanulata]
MKGTVITQTTVSPGKSTSKSWSEMAIARNSLQLDLSSKSRIVMLLPMSLQEKSHTDQHDSNRLQESGLTTREQKRKIKQATFVSQAVASYPVMEDDPDIIF